MTTSDAESLRLKLGLPAAPLVIQGLTTACNYFRSTLQEDPRNWVDYFRGIDFHCPVTDKPLPTGTPLSQHASLGTARPKPFVYFTKPGTSRFSTGTSFDAVQFRRFETTRLTNALTSTASPISFNRIVPGAARSATFDPVSRMGGGTQYILSTTDARSLRAVP